MALSFLIAIMLMVVFARPALALTDKGERRDIPEIPKAQAFVVSGMNMTVPISYLQSLELPPDSTIRLANTVGQSILLHTLAPEMTPPPYDFLRHWKGGKGFPKYVRFSIQIPRHGYKETYLLKNARKAVETGKCRAEKAGDSCADPRKLPFRNKFEILYTGVHHEFIFCGRWGSVPSPRCEVSLILPNDIIVDVRFDRRILNFDDPVWNRVYRLVCLWIDLPADRSLTINRCRTLGVQ